MADVDVVVSTPLGGLKGKTILGARGDIIYGFLGVPYAKPPLGDLRFKDPTPVDAWFGVRLAQNSAPIAAALNPLSPEPALFPGCSEDCLYLNIYVPVEPKPQLKLPVMVYIHGGGFQFGSGNKEVLGPDFLVPQGVILVSINYRVGPFGFLSFNNKECPGNFGLKDQTLGLRWVKDNISSFGGDPDNITLFGESAGAGSVHFHILSAQSKGLFHRAIAQSGCALNRWAISRFPRESALILAKRLGATSDDSDEALKVIRGASTEEVLFKSKAIFVEVEGNWAADSAIDLGFGPVVETTNAARPFLTIHPKQAVAEGLYADVPFIAGICSDEMLFTLPGVDYVPPYKDETGWQELLPKELNIPLNNEKMLKAGKLVGEFYFPNGTDQQGYIKATTDMFFTHGIFKTIEAHLKNPKKTTPNYLYVFKGGREMSSIKAIANLLPVKGTSHADDLDYLFTGEGGLALQWPIEDGSRERRIQLLLLKLWTDFAKTGIPSPDWPPTTESNSYSYAELEEEITIKKDFYQDQVKFWDKIYDTLQS